MLAQLFIEQPLELKFYFLRRVAAFMFDVDDGGGRYDNALPCHLNLKPLTLLKAIRKPPQFLDKLFNRIIPFDITFAFFLLGCHLRFPFNYDLVISSVSLVHE